MAIFFESDTEELGSPNVVLPHQYEPAPNQLKIDEPTRAAMILKMKKPA